ncbi:MAG: DoxX family protein [Phycisphaerae bacterium]|nr:DoxX family protein [Phycisphaerae bacterium]
MSEPRAGSSAWSVAALVLRVVLGGVFIFAASIKLGDPQGVSEGIQAFRVPGMPDHLIILGSYVLPWTELFAGVALVLGLWTRASALAIAAMLALFIAMVYSIIAREIHAECGCFGKFRLLCEAKKMGWCKVVENSTMLAMALSLVAFGGGRFGLDRVLGNR